METFSRVRAWLIHSAKEKELSAPDSVCSPARSTTATSWCPGKAHRPTYMQQPLLPAFSNPANSLVGLGPSGIVGVNGPVLASQAFSAFTHTGVYPSPSSLLQFPLGYVPPRGFPERLLRRSQPRGRKRDRRRDLFVSVGYRFYAAQATPLSQHQRAPERHPSDWRPGIHPSRS